MVFNLAATVGEVKTMLGEQRDDIGGLRKDIGGLRGELRDEREAPHRNGPVVGLPSQADRTTWCVRCAMNTARHKILATLLGLITTRLITSLMGC